MPRLKLESGAKEKQLEAPKLGGIREVAFMATPPLRPSRGSEDDETRGILLKEDPGGRNLVAAPGIYSVVDSERRDAIVLVMVVLQQLL